MSSFTPAQTGHSRVFLIPWRAAPNRKPKFMSCLKAGAPDLSLGDVEDIECPSPTRAGEFVKMGEVQGALGRATMDLMGRYAVDLQSELLYYAKLRCAVDLQVHFGPCTDPSAFNTFTKALIFEHARLTNWSVDEIGALSSDEAAAINETSPISAREMYEVLPLSLRKEADDIITTEIIDVVICDRVSCGECDTISDGCSHIYAVSVAAGGSPGTPADIVFSIDGGKTWYADDIDSIDPADDPRALFCLGNYVVVLTQATPGLHYALKSEIDDVDYDETWIEVTTGFVNGANDGWKGPGMSLAFVVGFGGYVYKCEDPVSGVTVLDAGVATSENLLAVHAISDENAVAVGNNGAIVFTENGESWSDLTATSPSIANLSAIWMKDDSTWFIGAADGELWYTLNKGADWTFVADYGSRVDDVAFSTDSVGYLVVVGDGPLGKVLRTFDGGYSWTVLPEGVATTPVNQRLVALAACTEDANFFVAVGLADDGVDGIIIVGED